MRRCKQTGSCLHRASAALSIFNSVRNSSRAGGGGRNVWFRTRHVGSTLKFADGLICLQIVPQNEEPVAHISRKKDPFRDAKGDIWVYSYGWEYLAALTAGNHREISRRSGFFLNPKGFENMGAKLCYACVANARRTAEEQWSYLRHFKGPIPFFFLSVFYF